MTFSVHPSAEAVSRALIARILQVAAETSGVVNIALSGGSTPALLFRLWASEYADATPWERLRFFWADERCVPPDDPQSNFGMTKRTLLDHAPIAPEQVFRIRGEADPSAEALRCTAEAARLVPARCDSEERLRTEAPCGSGEVAPAAVPCGSGEVVPAAVPCGSGEVVPAAVPCGSGEVVPAAVPCGSGEVVPAAERTPQFDIVLLGIGEDGHTASIFPGQEALLSAPQTYAVAVHPESGQRRITLTGRPLLQAARLFFLVCGSPKAEVLADLYASPDAGPAAFVAHNARHTVEIFADADAAALLP